MRFSVCRSAHLLQLMELNQKVASLDDLQFQDASRDLIGLKPGKRLRAFRWLWSAENEISYYFIPIEYLPQD